MPAEPSSLSFMQRVGYFTINLVIRGVIQTTLALPHRLRVPLMGSLMTRVIAPATGATKRIRHNLKLTCPEMSDEEIRYMCRAVPNNAGRTLIETYAGRDFVRHASTSPPRGDGVSALEQARESGKPVFLATAHFGNYFAIRANLSERGLRMGSLYRRMKNPYFNAHYVRSISFDNQLMFEQGGSGMRRLVKHLRQGGIIGILHDVYVTDGEQLTFFGQPCTTSLAIATMALKYNAAIIPSYGIRAANGLNFDVVLNDPIPHTDPRTMTQALNDDLERMVRENMAQWFWVHRRWK